MCSEFYLDYAKIATNASISVAQLTALNPGLDCTNLQRGQVLCLQSSSTPAPTSIPTSAPMPTLPPGSCYVQHTVASAETCTTISTNAGITSIQLSSLNPGLDCSNLAIGQVLCITKSPCSATYTVQHGDNCFAISQANHLSLTTLQWYNPQVNCSTLQPGEVMCLLYATSKRQARSVNPKQHTRDDTSTSLPGLFQPFAPTMTDMWSYDTIMAGFTSDQIYWDNVSLASYAYNGTYFVSFDTVQAVQAKMDYIKEWNLGGVIMWMLGYDSQGTLLKLMHDTLNPGET